MPKKGPKPLRRVIEEVSIQAVVSTYDDMNRLVARRAMDSVQMIRTTQPDIWSELDRLLRNTELAAQQQALQQIENAAPKDKETKKK